MLNLPSLEAGTPHARTESVALVVTGALPSIFPGHSPLFLVCLSGQVCLFGWVAGRAAEPTYLFDQTLEQEDLMG
jgi:hypothetical protein